jgi:hypothetical protein
MAAPLIGGQDSIFVRAKGRNDAQTAAILGKRLQVRIARFQAST